MGVGSLKELRRARAQLRDAADALDDARIEVGEARGPGRRVVMALVVAAVVLLAFAGWSGWRWAQTAGAYTDADYVDAARERVALLLAPDHRRPEAAQRILAGATGDFHDQFAQSADAYTDYVAQAGTEVDGVVDAAALAERHGDDAEVLIAASARITATPVAGDSAGEAETSTVHRRFRLRVTVTPEHGVLKLSDVGYLP